MKKIIVVLFTLATALTALAVNNGKVPYPQNFQEKDAEDSKIVTFTIERPKEPPKCLFAVVKDRRREYAPLVWQDQTNVYAIAAQLADAPNSVRIKIHQDWFDPNILPFNSIGNQIMAGQKATIMLKQVLETDYLPEMKAENQFLSGNVYLGISYAPGSALKHNNVPDWLKSSDGKYTAVILTRKVGNKREYAAVGTSFETEHERGKDHHDLAKERAEALLTRYLNLPPDTFFMQKPCSLPGQDVCVIMSVKMAEAEKE